MYFYTLNFIILILNLNNAITEPILTFEQFYEFGKNEYTLKEWQNCVAFFLRAIDDFNYFQDEIIWCRKKCLKYQFLFNETDDLKNINDIDDFMTTKIMYSEAQRSLCLLKLINKLFFYNNFLLNHF